MIMPVKIKKTIMSLTVKAMTYNTSAGNPADRAVNAIFFGRVLTNEKLYRKILTDHINRYNFCERS